MTTTRVPPAARPTPPSRPSRSRPARDTPHEEHAPGAVVADRRLFAAESANYFLLLGTTLFLVAFGLVMVLSSSSVESYKANDGNAFTDFLKQGMFAVIGVPIMLVASRLPASFWKRWAWVGIGGAMVFQLLVFTPLGITVQGNTNWVKIAGFTAQPSELVKLALIVWIAFIIARKEHLIHEPKHLFLPIAPVAGLAILLVLAGRDQGTAMIMFGIVFGCLYFAGVRLRHLAAAAVAIGLIILVFTASTSNRTSRISLWLTGCPTDVSSDGTCWQPVHGTWAMASGGIFGVGLGNSKMKWSWLPAAENDYIFAIVGEELGLIGAIVVLLLFIVLAISFVRVIRSSDEAFTRVVASGVMIWVIGQALVNIAVVLGLLPVLGVPLPLISAGGSSLVSILLGIGVVLSLSRHPNRGTDAVESVVQTPAERSRLAAAQRVRSRS